MNYTKYWYTHPLTNKILNSVLPTSRITEKEIILIYVRLTDIYFTAKSNNLEYSF